MNKQNLDIQFGLLQLEVVLFAPQLLRLLHRRGAVDFDVAVVDDLVAIVLPADSDLNSFTCRKKLKRLCVISSRVLHAGNSITSARLEHELAFRAPEAASKHSGVED